MKYQVIARKFRPKIFGEVVGQKPIVRTLQNAIESDRIGHAYLFSGPRGVGKTTTARILAKGLNCVNGPSATPCNECPSCREIAAAQSMDVLEIDGASNNGVDNIRELRDSARYAPSRDRYKIFIIDEVHMLSTPAFNALLKVLEEPPAHVVFIMATTERHKLPATILSRCQQFVFRTISAAEIQAHLRQIADREGAHIDDRGLSYIVKAAEGSMRDAQSLLDQIISFGGQEIAHDDVRDVLGFIPGEILDRTTAALASRDSRELLECVDIVVDQGLSIQQYVRECIGRMRDLLMMKLGLDDKVLGSADDKKSLSIDSSRFSEQDLIRYFDLLLRLENELKWTSQPRLHLEAGLVKLSKAGYVRDIEEVIREFRQGSVAPTNPVAPQAKVPAPEIARKAVQSAAPPTMLPLAKEPSPPKPETVPRTDSKSSMDVAKEEPLVRRFLDVFRGDIAQVKPSKGEPT
ncbi:MAG TPA: DNA polymerase III subunit gamma/tau [Terriglobia bacterium]|nr:DNA polymerase III subunit gamma/tau [Terriglobia bacterium]